MLFMFSAGKVVDEKLTVTNAADAAAYSAGIAHARALNYEAYVNRAIIANELAIAQAVSMVSWVRYFEAGVNNVGTLDQLVVQHLIAGGIPIAAVMSGTAYLNYWTGGQGLQEIVEIIEYINSLGIINIHAGAIIALRASQLATDLAFSSGVPQRDLAEEVARRSDASLDVELVPTSIVGLAGFTSTYGRFSSGGDARGRLADTVMRSRDEFTAQRVFTHFGPNIPFVQRNVSLRKRGGTDLINFDEWQAADTLAVHRQTWPCFRKGIPRWCDQEEIPIAGAARSETGIGGSGGGSGSYGYSTRDNPRTTSNALGANQDLRELGAVLWLGLSDNQDVADLDAGRDQRVGISFFVSKPDNTSRAAGRNPNVRPTGQLATFDAAAPGNRIASLSRAEVFFMRPDARPDGRRELASLYSPYWQSRLVAPTTADRLYAASRQNGLALGL
ncbi:MAG: hypothetical protein ACXW13_07970 [Burkholderiaceae bacterium]